jgi:hypothetical protein
MRFTGLLVLVGIAGCAAPTEAPPPTEPTASITSTDACATRLHDLSGDLLLHLLSTGELPASLAEIDAGDAACPVSGRPYVYEPDGIFLQDLGEYVILFDAAASHDGQRWAVRYRPGDLPAGVAPATQVVAMPERFFTLRP